MDDTLADPAHRAPARRALRRDRAHRARRDGHGLPGHRHAAGPRGGAQGHARRTGQGRGVRPPVHRRGQVGGAAVAPERGRGLRPGRRRPVPVPGDGVRARAHAEGTAQGQRAVSPRDGAGDHGRRARRARGRARLRDRAPRRQAGERPGDRRRPDQGGRLRPGPGAVGGRAHPGRAAHRHGRVRAARAGDRRDHRPARRRLLGRRDALRAAHRPAAVHRRHPALDRLPARQHRCPGPVRDGARHPGPVDQLVLAATSRDPARRPADASRVPACRSSCERRACPNRAGSPA